MFTPPFYLKNKHLQTIIPALFRKVKGVNYEREVVNTPDNDFIDLDWNKVDSKSLVLLFHGLEGNSYSQYILGLSKVLAENKFDTSSVNFRGCGGSPNNLLTSYHSGKSDDIRFLVSLIAERNNYDNIYLVGFSLGGNALLKYLGESQADEKVKKAVVVSVPCDLKASAIALSKGFNIIYIKRFLKKLKEKVNQKEVMFPDAIDYQLVYKSKDFQEFDDRFTAPIHGYKDANEYWKKCSSKQFIQRINVPTKIINALNDPFLPDECYPYGESNSNPNVELLTPKNGGHVGFPKNVENINYYENEIISFFKND